MAKAALGMDCCYDSVSSGRRTVDGNLVRRKYLADCSLPHTVALSVWGISDNSRNEAIFDLLAVFPILRVKAQMTLFGNRA